MFYTGNTFLPPLPAFPKPVSPPESDPDEGDQVAICFGRDWLPYVLGALASLVLPTTWQGDADAVLLAQYRSALLLAMVGNPDEDCDMNCATVNECVASVQERFDPETGAREVSYDNGETWVDGTSTDPRFVGSRFDDVTGSCGDANSIVRMVQESIDQTIDNINGGLAVAGVLTVLMAIIATALSAGALAPLALGMITAITAAGTGTVTAALTNALWEQFRCIVYLEIQGATAITAEHYENIRDALPELGSAPAQLAIWQALTQLGPVGMQNAAIMGMAALGIPAECDDCGTWCFTFDFTTSDGGWTVTPSRASTWVDTTGWTEGVWNGADLPGCANRFYAQVNIRKTFDPTIVTRIAMTFSGDNGFIDNAAAINNQINGWNDATQEINLVVNENFGTNITQEWTGSETLDRIELQASVGTRCGANTGIQSANFRIHTVVIEGIGDNPFGADNC